MNSLQLFVCILLAGSIGSVLRAFVIALLPRTGLDLVNVLGTLLLAVVVASVGDGRLAEEVAAVLGIGLAGSLTTFSAWIAAIEASAGSGGWVRTIIRGAAVVALCIALTILSFVVVG